MRNVLIREHPGSSSGLAGEVARLKGLLVELGRRISLRDPLGELGAGARLTAPQVHAVLWLGTEGVLSMRSLSQRGGVSVKTMTGIVDRLEQAGLVQRERDGVDRRVIRVRLTRRGGALQRRVDARLDAKMKDALALLDERDRKSLCGIFERLLRRLAGGAKARG